MRVIVLVGAALTMSGTAHADVPVAGTLLENIGEIFLAGPIFDSILDGVG
ncbi:hypothetical protein [Streptomyces toxytricini]